MLARFTRSDPTGIGGLGGYIMDVSRVFGLKDEEGGRETN